MSFLHVPQWIELIRKSIAWRGVVQTQRPVLNFSSNFTLSDDQRNGRTDVDVNTTSISFEYLNFEPDQVEPSVSSGVTAYVSGGHLNVKDVNGGIATFMAVPRFDLSDANQDLSVGIANDFWLADGTLTTARTGSLISSGTLPGSVATFWLDDSGPAYVVMDALFSATLYTKRPGHKEVADFLWSETGQYWSLSGVKTLK